MAVKVKIDGLDSAIMDALKEYSQDVNEGIKEDCKAVAKGTVKMLKQTSPRLTGSYQKGWSQQTSFENSQDIRVTVYNRTDYQLTHLLEYGHVIKNGTGRVYGSVAAEPHIAAAEAYAQAELPKRMEETIKNA